MNVGTVFDAIVKSWLNRRLRAADLLRGINDERAIEIGSNLASIYRATGALAALEAEGVGQVEIEKETLVNGVPIYGKPDFTMADGTIGDWKTSLSGSPKPGYVTRREWLIDSAAVYIPEEQKHEKHEVNLEEVDHDWALQTTVYAFMLGHKVGNPLKCRIEHIVVQAKKVVIAGYYNPISPEFQKQIWEEPKEIWEMIMSNDIPKPTFNQWKCFAYGKKCEVAHLCPAFQDSEKVGFKEPDTDLLGDMG